MIQCSGISLAGEKLEQLSNTTFEIKNFSECYGNVAVRIVNQDFVTNGGYELLNCERRDKYVWYCECKNNKTNIILSTNNLNSSYDIMLQYYIFPKIMIDNNLSDDITGQKVANMNNVYLVDKIYKEEESFKMPEFDNKNLIIITIITIFLGCIFGLFLIFKKIFNEKNLEDL